MVSFPQGSCLLWSVLGPVWLKIFNSTGSTLVPEMPSTFRKTFQGLPPGHIAGESRKYIINEVHMLYQFCSVGKMQL